MMLKNRFQQRLSGRRLQRGQGMTEYIIIVALVAIAAIAVYSFFGQAVRGQMASITSQLAGSAGATGYTQAQAVACQGQYGSNQPVRLEQLQDQCRERWPVSTGPERAQRRGHDRTQAQPAPAACRRGFCAGAWPGLGIRGDRGGDPGDRRPSCVQQRSRGSHAHPSAERGGFRRLQRRGGTGARVQLRGLFQSRHGRQPGGHSADGRARPRGCAITA